MERAGSAASLASGSDKAAGGIQGSTNAETTASQNSTSSPPLARARPPILSPASLVASLPAAAFPTDPAAVHVPTTDVQAVYIADARDLQTEFERMRAGFEGKEMEHNWMVRDRSVARIRGIVKGKVQERLLEPFLVGLKGAQDGIVKTVRSGFRRSLEAVVDGRPCRPPPSAPLSPSPLSISSPSFPYLSTTPSTPSLTSLSPTYSVWRVKPRRSSPAPHKPPSRLSSLTPPTTIAYCTSCDKAWMRRRPARAGSSRAMWARFSRCMGGRARAPLRRRGVWRISSRV